MFSHIRNDAWKTTGAHIHLRMIIHRMHNNTISHTEIRECLKCKICSFRVYFFSFSVKISNVLKPRIIIIGKKRVSGKLLA